MLTSFWKLYRLCPSSFPLTWQIPLAQKSHWDSTVKLREQKKRWWLLVWDQDHRWLSHINSCHIIPIVPFHNISSNPYVCVLDCNTPILPSKQEFQLLIWGSRNYQHQPPVSLWHSSSINQTAMLSYGWWSKSSQPIPIRFLTKTTEKTTDQCI